MSTGKSKKTISSSDHKVEEPIQIIGKRLEERVDFFMSNIDAIVRKYRNYQASATLPTDLGCISVTPEETITTTIAPPRRRRFHIRDCYCCSGPEACSLRGCNRCRR